MAESSDTYSPLFGFVYIFNLVIGVGALALPKAFSQAGLILGTLLLLILAFVSYVTATYMVEAMSIANAYMKYRARTKSPQLSTNTSTIQRDLGVATDSESEKNLSGNEKTPLVPNTIDPDFESSEDDSTATYIIPPDDYEITKKYEMGTMANMFYHPVGIVIYYIVICLYLYGDLAIYLVAIPKSIVTVVCPNENVTSDNSSTINPALFVANSTCFREVTKQNAYYLFLFAIIYMFNLILGAGPLALPKAFSMAGFVLGSILLVFLAFMSFMTATFMIEAMANANAYVRYQTRKESREEKTQRSRTPSFEKDTQSSMPYDDDDSDIEKDFIVSDKEEHLPLTSLRQEKESCDESNDSKSETITPDDYEITEKFEMGTIANMFYKPFGIVFYYFIICLYLNGTLAIDLVVITKSLVTVTCTKPPDDDNVTESDFIHTIDSSNVTSIHNFTESPTNFPGQFVSHNLCFGDNLTQRQVYYIYLSITALLICPWTYLNFTSSKYIQLATTVMRNIAFGLMISIAIAKLAMGQSAEPLPPLASAPGFPVLFGVSIYAFMTQHCLPGMVTPMTSKRGITWMILGNFGFILGFYLLLSYTAVFLFPSRSLYGIYTINFFKLFEFSDPIGDQVLSILGYYIVLYPVFTLTTNFPISSITLRENLKSLARVVVKPWYGDKPFPFLVDLLLFPTVAILPPLAIAFATTSIEVLVSITGGFPGIWLQYMIPASLAFAGKYIITRKLKFEYKNKHKSPFSHIVFLVFVIVWTVTSMVLVITNDIISIVNHNFFDGVW